MMRQRGKWLLIKGSFDKTMCESQKKRVCRTRREMLVPGLLGAARAVETCQAFSPEVSDWETNILSFTF